VIGSMLTRFSTATNGLRTLIGAQGHAGLHWHGCFYMTFRWGAPCSPIPLQTSGACGHRITQASVNRFLDAEFGLSSDTFGTNWTIRHHASVRVLKPLRGARLIAAELSFATEAEFICPAAHIAAEQRKLIHILDIWDETSIAKMSKDYEVDPIQGFLESRKPYDQCARV